MLIFPNHCPRDVVLAEAFADGAWANVRAEVGIGGLDDLVKEGLDPIVDFSEVFVAAAEVDWVALDFDKFVAVQDLAVVELIGVVGLGEYVLDNWPSIDEPFAHAVVL